MKKMLCTKIIPKKQQKQSIFGNVQSFQSQLSSLIANVKNKYYSKVTKKILDPSTSPKTYWPIWKTFLNNKKIPVIPPIFHETKFITDFEQKAEIFNSYISKQYQQQQISIRMSTRIKWIFIFHYFLNKWHWKNNWKPWPKQISWPWYGQYLHFETVWWIHLQTFQPSFQILFRS